MKVEWGLYTKKGQVGGKAGPKRMSVNDYGECTEMFYK